MLEGGHKHEVLEASLPRTLMFESSILSASVAARVRRPQVAAANKRSSLIGSVMKSSPHVRSIHPIAKVCMWGKWKGRCTLLTLRNHRVSWVMVTAVW